MILGETYIRNGKFCSIKTVISFDVDKKESIRVAQTNKILQLKHCVITLQRAMI